MEEIDAREVIASRKKRKRETFKSIKVDKDDDLVFDLANLYAFDAHTISEQRLKGNGIDDEARDNVQLLMSRIFEQPVEKNLLAHEREGVGAVVSLPAADLSVLHLPREKPLPKPKEMTKWERYAKVKGIQKKKRGRMVFDEVQKEWRPRYGYKRARDSTDAWLMEDKNGATYSTGEDPFLKAARDKKERVSKQKQRELKNQQKASAKTNKNVHRYAGTVGAPSGNERRQFEKSLLASEVKKARGATASMGKFDRSLPQEGAAAKKRRGKQVGKKLATGVDVVEERQKNLRLADRILSSQGGVDSQKAVKFYNKERYRKK